MTQDNLVSWTFEKRIIDVFAARRARNSLLLAGFGLSMVIFILIVRQPSFDPFFLLVPGGFLGAYLINRWRERFDPFCRLAKKIMLLRQSEKFRRAEGVSSAYSTMSPEDLAVWERDLTFARQYFVHRERAIE